MAGFLLNAHQFRTSLTDCHRGGGATYMLGIHTFIHAAERFCYVKIAINILYRTIIQKSLFVTAINIFKFDNITIMLFNSIVHCW